MGSLLCECFQHKPRVNVLSGDAVSGGSALDLVNPRWYHPLTKHDQVTVFTLLLPSAAAVTAFVLRGADYIPDCDFGCDCAARGSFVRREGRAHREAGRSPGAG